MISWIRKRVISISFDPVVVCGDDNFRRKDQIKMCFGAIYQSPEYKVRFINQPYPNKISKIRALMVFLKTTVLEKSNM